MKVREHIGLLGLRAKDRVTGLAGVISSISFDLYGCIQAVLNPGLDKDGKPMDCMWFDVARLEVAPDEKPVMIPPNYDYGAQADGRQGPSEKPSRKA